MSDDQEMAAQLDTIARSMPEPPPLRLEPAWASTAGFNELLSALSTSGDFIEFEDDRLQVFGQGASAVSLRDLAGWMVERAVSVGGDKAIQEVRDYISRDELTGEAVMLLTGLRPEEVSDLGGGVRLVPAHALPTERLRRATVGAMFDGLPLPKPTGGLVCEFTQKRQHHCQTEYAEHREFTMLPHERLEDARLSLTMSRPGGLGVQGIATAAVAEDHLPVLGGTGWHMHEYHPASRPQSPFLQFEAERARAFHVAFLGAEDSHRRKLRIPLSRLNKAAATSDGVERAVALRTAMESLFLDDKIRGSISYRLALRSALFTESELAERQRVRDEVADLYGVCSTAVHDGRLPEGEKKRTGLVAGELLKRGSHLVFKAIAARLHSPRVNWRDVELLGGLPEEGEAANL